jgi:hypothetical protein
MSVNDLACDEQSEAQAILAFGSGSAKSVKHVWQFIGGDRGAPVMYSDADLAIFVAKLKANRRPSVTVDECVRNEVTNHLRESIGIPSAIEIAVALKFDLPFGMKGSHFVQHAARDGRKVSLPGRDGNARSEPAACEVKQIGDHATHAAGVRDDALRRVAKRLWKLVGLQERRGAEEDHVQRCA